MSQLAAVDISDSDRFELAEVLREESESSAAPRLLEDILQETCDDDFDPMSQRSCYELLAAYIAALKTWNIRYSEKGRGIES